MANMHGVKGHNSPLLKKSKPAPAKKKTAKKKASKKKATKK